MMRSFAMTLIGAATLLGCAAAPAETNRPASATLRAFASDAELTTYLTRLGAEQTRRSRASPANGETSDAQAMPSAVPPPPMVAAPAPGGDIVTTAARSITNNQVSGVDEGDIVKARGNLLVVLRRGRLFTVATGDTLRPISMIQAYPPGADASGDWYDEMLLDGDRVIIVGYSYARGGTQVNRFHLTSKGRLSFEDSYAFRSNDYYSTRNYASRLIGHRLILYSPLYLRTGANGDWREGFPAMRRWRGGSNGGDWQPIGGATTTYIPSALLDVSKADVNTLHSVTSCDITAPVLDCHATGVLGSASRSFFVSQDAIYLWIGGAWRDEAFGKDSRHSQSFLYRLPLDGSAPSAVQVRGNPIDQFSFAADAARGALNVLVQPDSDGDMMGSPERGVGALALLRVPTAAFGDGSSEVPLNRYRALPPVPEGSLHDRFVGDWLVYGVETYSEAASNRIWAVPVGGGAVATLDLPHKAERIEAIGSDAMVIGQGGQRSGSQDGSALGFTAIALPARGAAQLQSTYQLTGAAQGDSRSHGFFYLPDAGRGGGSGTIGLPTLRPATGNVPDDPGGAAVQFLRRDGGQLHPIGELASYTRGAADDSCVASCYDWYGNARPIFLDDRVYALLGYELVGGRIQNGGVAEFSRTSFAPPPPAPERK